MAYTIKRVAAMSGVSVRTLHFYDEVDLLKPAYTGANGYRYYEEAQLLYLQQILFYRELGFELKQIAAILEAPDFDKVAALESHRKVLKGNLSRTRELLRTVEMTIEHLKGTHKMKTNELFTGFDPEQQAAQEEYLVTRFGHGAAQTIAEAKGKVKGWKQEDWQQSGNVFAGICQEMVKLMRDKARSDGDEAQKLVRRHYQWIQQFWIPTRESYAGHSQLIVDSDLRKAYEAYGNGLPEYMAAAIHVFANNELA